MLYTRRIILFFLLAVFSMVPQLGAQDVKLIANPDVQVDSLSVADVKRIFLGMKTHWKNGSKIIFFTTKKAATHEAFLKSYVGQSSNQYRKFWRNMVFAGKGKFPKTSGSDQEMVNFIVNISGAIGYVSAGADLGNAKTISVR